MKRRSVTRLLVSELAFVRVVACLAVTHAVGQLIFMNEESPSRFGKEMKGIQ
jgi:hypothetical protein